MADEPKEEETKSADDEIAEATPVAATDEVGDGTDAIFEALWKRVEEAWDDDKPHQAILAHAIDRQMMPELAGRYRALKDHPKKGARAQKKIDGIVIAATQIMMAMKTPERTKTPWQWTASAALVFAIICGWLFYKLFVPHR